MKRLSLNARNGLARAALLITLLLIVHVPASAQWDPPGDDDPCDDLFINCGNALNLGNMASAADAADRAGNDRCDEGDPASCFFKGAGELLKCGYTYIRESDPDCAPDGGGDKPDPPKDPPVPPPPPPPPPPPVPPPDPPEDPTKTESQAYSIEDTDGSLRSDIRRGLDRFDEGSQIYPSRLADGTRVRYQLLSKRERNQNKPGEFQVTLYMTLENKRKGFKERSGVVLTGRGRHLYLTHTVRK